jgi:chromosome segregation ATPase
MENLLLHIGINMGLFCEYNCKDVEERFRSINNKLSCKEKQLELAHTEIDELKRDNRDLMRQLAVSESNYNTLKKQRDGALIDMVNARSIADRIVKELRPCPPFEQRTLEELDKVTRKLGNLEAEIRDIQESPWVNRFVTPRVFND